MQKSCETGDLYEVLEITVRTKSSCWQCARNFCIFRCCPTVTWLSSLLYFLRFNWCNENVFFVDHLLQCRSSTARLSNSYEIQIKRSAHTGSLGNVNNKKTLIFFAFFLCLTILLLETSLDLGICCLQPATNLRMCPTLLFELRVTKVG